MANPPSNTSSTSELPAFGSYVVVRKIGDGGMGAVYEARHESLGKRVALKVLLPEMAANREIAARFVREGQAAARIRHPHVVDVYDVGTSTGGTFLVMELLEGNDLGALLESRAVLSVSEALAILLPVFSAVAAAHREGVIHRDIKPANIFLSRDSIGRLHPKVVDFGISKIVEDQSGLVLTQSAAVLGTPYYMAPEQVQAVKNTDARSDQYSLAVMLYECVTGQRPYSGDSLYELLLAITGKEAVPANQLMPSLPPALSEVIQRAMSRDASGRFASVRDFGRALLPFADEFTRRLWASEFDDRSGAAAAPDVRRSADGASRGASPIAEASTVGLAESSVPAASAAGSAAAATGLEFSSAPVTRPAPSHRKLVAGVFIAFAVVAGGSLAALLAMRSPSDPDSTAGAGSNPLATPEPTLTASGSAVGAPLDAAPSASSEAAGSSSAIAVTGVPSSSQPASSVATPSQPRKEPGSGKSATTTGPSATPAATPTEPGDGAIRGANSAWIVR